MLEAVETSLSVGPLGFGNVLCRRRVEGAGIVVPRGVGRGQGEDRVVGDRCIKSERRRHGIRMRGNAGGEESGESILFIQPGRMYLDQKWQLGERLDLNEG